MSEVEALKKELVRIRQQNRELKNLSSRFTLAGKAQKIINGEFSTEYDELGARLDGEQGSRYIVDDTASLEETIASMKAIDIRDTQNIEILLKLYLRSSVLQVLAGYDLHGFKID